MTLSKRRLVAVAAAVAALFVVVVAPVPASQPPSGTVTVPSTIGATVTHTWSGTILPGANPTSKCTSVPEAASDVHTIGLDVPTGLYNTVAVDYTFRIEWQSEEVSVDGVLAPHAVHDEILTVVAPDGSELASADGGRRFETIRQFNLPAGTYKVLACPFAAAVPVNYTGTLTVTTRDPLANLAAAPAEGLEFSASVATENQRDESEPLVEIDGNGNIFACGPSGSSQAAEYASVSTDGGESYHLLGTPPRGQLAAGGGGDCALAFGLQPNSGGHYDWAYSGLGPLTGFATAKSPNSARSIATGGFNFEGGVTNQGAVADRQWLTFVSETDVLMTYNQQQPRNTVVLRSTDKGLTYNVADAKVGAASPRFPGPIRYDKAHNLVYFAWDDNDTLRRNPSTTSDDSAADFVMLSVSRDNGTTWTVCNVDVLPGATTTLFATADHDSEGNIYVAYGENANFHTYVRVLPASAIAAGKCTLPSSTLARLSVNTYGTDAGANFGPRVQVDRGAVNSTVFPWITAGGAPGRVAVTFLGTETEGNPNLGTFKASWDVYVNVSTNMLSTDPLSPPTFSQVKATTHPFHYDSICLNGLGCDLSIPPGDRSMADFMSIDYNPVTQRLTAVFNRTNKKPGESGGHVATTMAVTQTGGPTLGGSVLTPTKPVLRTSDVDPTGDALSSYSHTAVMSVPPDPATANEPAADFTSIAVGPEVDLNDGAGIENGGFTVTMKVADLSTAALRRTADRTSSQSLLWVFRFTNGYQDAAASARWNPIQGFSFGYNDYTTGSAPCVATAATTGEKCLAYPGTTPINGKVDQASGTIRFSVPRYLLRALSGGTGHLERPSEVPATVGSRFYDATAWSLGNTVSPIQDVQSFLYPFDSTPAFDFLLVQGSGGGESGCKATGAGSIGDGDTDPRFALSVHAPAKGSVAYRDRAAGVDFRSTSISSVTCDGGKATIRGTGYQGNDEVTFTAVATDGATDQFSIALSPSGYSRSGNVTRGNVGVKS